ncbi:HEAT repeat domain-containing protein [Thalassococcus sp. BH17M4-6]
MLVCMAAGTRAQTPEPVAQATLSYDTEDHTVTLHAPKGADRSDIVAQIAALANAGVRIDFPLGLLHRPVAFEDLSVEQALKRLLGEASVVLFYDDSGIGPASIRKVWIVADGQPAAPAAQLSAQIDESEPQPAAPAKDPSVQAAAVRDVIKLGYDADPEAVGRLKELAIGDPDANVRRAALSTLAGLPGSNSFQIFATNGLRDPDPSVRVEAARSLIRTGNINSRPILRHAAAREEDPTARTIMDQLARGQDVARESEVLQDRLLR